MSEATPEKDEDLAEGTLLSHLAELRNRLFKVLVSVFVIFVALLPFAQTIFNVAAEPLINVVPGGQLYQAWAFVAPGLYKKERHFAFPLLASSIVLFYAGIAFAYFVVFPLIFGFVSSFTPDKVEYQPDMAEYVSFIMMVVLVFGLAFETPIATVLTVWTGLTTPAKLAKARPYVFLGAFVVGMLLTPPDVISQTILAIPVYLLFELGIILSRLFPAKPREDAGGTTNSV